MLLKRGSDHNDVATVHQYRDNKKRGPNMAALWRGVADNATAHIHVKRPLTLIQVSNNTYGSTISDDNNWNLAFFTPQKFKSHEAVAFNGKALTEGGSGVGGASQNLPLAQYTFIEDSYVTFRFKNSSRHKTIVEMYVCYGKDSQALIPGYTPPLTFNAVLSAKAGNENTRTQTSLDTNPMSEPQFLAQWKTTKTVFKMEPGEHAFHKLQGPKKYAMFGQRHVNIGTLPNSTSYTFLDPSYEGNGCYVWFRTLNDLGAGRGVEGQQNRNVAIGTRFGGPFHPRHKPFDAPAGTTYGAVIGIVNEHFKIRAPEGFVLNAGLTSTQMNTNQDSFWFLNQLQSFTNAASAAPDDIIIEADAPDVLQI